MGGGGELAEEDLEADLEADVRLLSKLEDVIAAPPTLLALPCGCVLHSKMAASLNLRVQREHGVK